RLQRAVLAAARVGARRGRAGGGAARAGWAGRRGRAGAGHGGAAAGRGGWGGGGGGGPGGRGGGGRGGGGRRARRRGGGAAACDEQRDHQGEERCDREEGQPAGSLTHAFSLPDADAVARSAAPAHPPHGARRGLPHRLIGSGVSARPPAVGRPRPPGHTSARPVPPRRLLPPSGAIAAVRALPSLPAHLLDTRTTPVPSDDRSTPVSTFPRRVGREPHGTLPSRRTLRATRR